MSNTISCQALQHLHLVVSIVWQLFVFINYFVLCSCGADLFCPRTLQVGLQKEGRSQSLNHLGNGEAAAQAPAVKRVNSESMISLIDFGADPEPVVATANVPDPFASAPANKVASDPFAAPVASANQSVVDLFAPGPGATPFADPFAAAAPAPAVTDPFASSAHPPTVADPFASAAPVRQVASDPFGFGVQAASGPSGNSSWATFDLNANTAPPEGYPGGFGANAAGPGLTTPFNASSAAWGNNTNSVGNAWSAFDLQAPAPSAPAPASVSVPAPAPLSQVRSFCLSSVSWSQLALRGL